LKWDDGCWISLLLFLSVRFGMKGESLGRWTLTMRDEWVDERDDSSPIRTQESLSFLGDLDGGMRDRADVERGGEETIE